MRTDQEIVDQTNLLAWKLYFAMGYVGPEKHNFYTATHPQEKMCWNMACIAQSDLTDTDPQDALDSLET